MFKIVTKVSSINDLPNETTRNIASFLHPQNIESFTSTCKLYYDLSKDILDEHRRRKKLYYRVDDKDPLVIPFFVSRPELAWYIKRLVIHQERTNFRDWSEPEADRVRDQNRVRDEGVTFRIFIEDILDIVRTGLVPATEEDTWMEQIKKGVDGPLKVLLLSLALNI